MKKLRLGAIILALAAVIAVSLASCGKKQTPADEGEVIAAAKELLGSAVEVNRIFFWGGLEYDEAKYISQSELMEKVRSVYTESYSDDIEKVAFEGVNVSDDSALLARYVSEGGVMKINVSQAKNSLPERIPDTDTVRIADVKDAVGADTAVIAVYAECGGERSEFTVTLKLEADGWRLDTPTY